jgi:hypothetical protein
MFFSRQLLSLVSAEAWNCDGHGVGAQSFRHMPPLGSWRASTPASPKDTSMTTTFLKRQKERKRQEKQIAKAQKRAQKKLEAQARLENPGAFAFDAGFEPPDPNDLNAVNHPNALPYDNGASEARNENAASAANAAQPVTSANTSYFASSSTPVRPLNPKLSAQPEPDSDHKSA